LHSARALFNLLAEVGPGIGSGRSLELRLALRAPEKIVHTLILDNDVRLSALEAFSAYRILEHRSFRYLSLLLHGYI
jgi:hypothetical protein